MLNNNGSFKVYASRKPNSERLRIVGSAVAKLADTLKLRTEVAPKENMLSIYVYYRGNGGLEIPVYSDWGKNWKEDEVFSAIRNMLFVLSFHPKHARLRTVRHKMCVPA
jgi:hypothetical protein